MVLGRLFHTLELLPPDAVDTGDPEPDGIPSTVGGTGAVLGVSAVVDGPGEGRAVGAEAMGTGLEPGDAGVKGTPDVGVRGTPIAAHWVARDGAVTLHAVGRARACVWLTERPSGF